MQINSLVSIGMPVYNGEQYIRQAIDSLLAQDHTNFELIISDNASSDNTEKICLDYVAQDSRIKYYSNNTNQGAFNNFIKVLDLAHADYFMWAAYDDVWEPSYISTLVKIMNEDTKVVLSFTMFDAIDAQNNKLVDYPNILKIPSDNISQRLTNYIDQHERLGKANPIYGLMRKEYTKKALDITSHLLTNDVWASDMLFVFQMLIFGRFSVAKDKLFHKRILPTAPSSSGIEDWYSYFNGYDYLIKFSKILDKKQKQALMSDVACRRIFRCIESPIFALGVCTFHFVHIVKKMFGKIQKVIVQN